MKLWLALAVTTTAACIEPNLTHCPGDYDCAPGLVCDLAHHGCVGQDQLDVCADLGPLAPCSTPSVSGECFDGVCLAPGCGNRVIEAGEECDDGNHVSGDGCTLDCASTEQCGNGVVDLSLGETCDDGNFASHDGCNSICGTETAGWHAYPIRISTFDPHGAAYDSTRDRIVYAAKHTTWEWDRQTQVWQVASYAQTIVVTWTAVVYDSDQHRMIGFGTTTAGGKTVTAEWDGSSWHPIVFQGNVPTTLAAAIYDPARHMILTVTSATSQYLDVANGIWRDSQLLPTPLDTTGFVLGYDLKRGVVVALGAMTTLTWEFDGANWSTPGNKPGNADSGWALAWDRTKELVVAVGGLKGGISYDGSVLTWDGTKWNPGSAMVKPRTDAFAWADATSSTIAVYSGRDANGTLGDFADVLGTLAIPMPVQPPAAGPVFYDSMRHRLLMFGNLTQWSWDGAWTVLAGQPTSAVDVIAYDPVRGAVVAHAPTTGLTWLFDDGWHSMPSGGSLGAMFPGVGTYDYANRRVVVVDGGATLALPSTATSWMSLGPGVASPGSAAYDLGASTVAVLGTTADTGLSDLVGNQWVGSLSPGSGYVVASAFDRTSVLMVPTSGSSRQIWERRHGTFATIGTMPVAGDSIAGIAETSNGRVVMAIDDSDTSYLLEYHYTSGAPEESCVPGEDADGDGLADCDDPDCWESCWPACPFATSCAP